MKDLVILLPTCRQDMFKRCLGTLRESPFHLHVVAQKFKPKLEHVYLDKLISTARANNHAFVTAPDAKYYMFIDDDFIFEEDWAEDVKFAISNLEQHKNIGAISLLDSKKIRSHKSSKVLGLKKKEIYYNDHNSVLFLRKESGIIIRKELVHTDLDITAYGEDFAKLIHCFLDGYEVCNILVDIRHMHNHTHENSWKNLSKQLFEIDDPRSDFYYNKLITKGILDKKGWTAKGMDIRKENIRRRHER